MSSNIEALFKDANSGEWRMHPNHRVDYTTETAQRFFAEQAEALKTGQANKLGDEAVSITVQVVPIIENNMELAT